MILSEIYAERVYVYSLVCFICINRLRMYEVSTPMINIVWNVTCQLHPEAWCAFPVHCV